MFTIGNLSIYEIGVIFFFILFLFVAAQTYFRHRREEHEELERFREQQRLDVIATEERKEFVMLHLNSQRLTLSRQLTDLEQGDHEHEHEEDEDDSSQSLDNIFTRTLCSAGKSFRELLGSSTATSKRECSICLAEFQPKETVSWAKSKECSHVFHQDCIIQWLEKHDECPLCRKDIIEGVDCEDHVSVVSGANDSDDNDADDGDGEQIEEAAAPADQSQMMTTSVHHEDLDQVPL